MMNKELRNPNSYLMAAAQLPPLFLPSKTSYQEVFIDEKAPKTLAKGIMVKDH